MSKSRRVEASRSMSMDGVRMRGKTRSFEPFSLPVLSVLAFVILKEKLTVQSLGHPLPNVGEFCLHKMLRSDGGGTLLLRPTTVRGGRDPNDGNTLRYSTFNDQFGK
jgi:hypothetical protein